MRKRPPSIDPQNFPEALRPTAKVVSSLLHSLNEWTDAYAWALHLWSYANDTIEQTRIKLAELGVPPDLTKPSVVQALLAIANEQMPYHYWQRIAIRDSSMSVYHFGAALDALRQRIGEHPHLRSIARTSEIKVAQKLFLSRFPDHNDVRNAVAHAAELSNSPSKLAANAFSGTHDGHSLRFDDVRDAMINFSIGPTLTISYNGRILTYTLDHEVLRLLMSVRDRVFSSINS